MYKTKNLRIFFYKCWLIIILVGLTFNLTTGCLKKPEKSSPKSITKAVKEPNTLKDLAESVEIVVKDFEKTFAKQTVPTELSSSKVKEYKESSNSTKHSDKNQEKQEEKKSNHDWSKTRKDITKIHRLWNEFRPDALESGIPSNIIEDFSDNLNVLTTVLTKKELFSGLILSNDLYNKTVSFEKFFQNKSSDLKTVMYLGRDATYKALYGRSDEAINSMQEAIDIWNTAKAQIKDTTLISKVEHSLKELLAAIGKQDPNLIKIKAKIGEKNIKGAINSIEKSK